MIETGFSEPTLKTNGKIFCDVDWYSVLFKAEIPETERNNIGVDYFSLVKINSGWKITSIVNEVVIEANPIPEGLND